MSRSERLVAVALVITAAVSVAKLWAASVTFSSTVFAEAVRSLVDLSSLSLLSWSLGRPAETRNRDAAFWAMVVPVLLFAFGAGIAIYEGIDALNRPRLLAEPNLIPAVLAVGLAAQAAQAGAAFRKSVEPGNDPARVALRITAGLGTASAALALAASGGAIGGLPDVDAAGAIATSAILALIAGLMAVEIKNRLTMAAMPGLQATASHSSQSTSREPGAPTMAAISAPPLPAAKSPKTKGKRRRR